MVGFNNAGVFFNVGADTEVEYEDGKGGTKTNSGKLRDPDEKGYVVIETDDGKIVHIPKSRIVDISQSVFNYD